VIEKYQTQEIQDVASCDTLSLTITVIFQQFGTRFKVIPWTFSILLHFIYKPHHFRNGFYCHLRADRTWRNSSSYLLGYLMSVLRLYSMGWHDDRQMMNWKELLSGCGLITVTAFAWRGWEKSWDSLCPGQDLYLAPPKSKSKVLLLDQPVWRNLYSITPTSGATIKHWSRRW
jgi:hypothetical protein